MSFLGDMKKDTAASTLSASEYLSKYEDSLRWDRERAEKEKMYEMMRMMATPSRSESTEDIVRRVIREELKKFWEEQG